ncbi:MAG: HPr(Ser) kinase/phosphatase [Kiritimatiellae bacterium]|nr:HPr(Ser) kinase/phosphatase [Kiritimatiellia bacterium]
MLRGADPHLFMYDRARPLTISNLSVPQLTVGRFLLSARGALGLDVVAGEKGLQRPIEEPIMYRPGLALTGFYHHFAFRRLQVLGRAECAYLQTLSPEERNARWKALLDFNVPGIILCRPDNEPWSGEILQMAEEVGIPVMVTPRESMEVFRTGSLHLHELTTPRASVHGTLVDIGGVGVLLEGPPGIGKSETALGLLRRGHALIADDMTLLSCDTHGKVVGTAPEQLRGFMEIRGLGLLHVATLFGIASVKQEASLDLIVSLRLCHTEDDIDRIGSDIQTYDILGIPIQRLTIPVAAGRDFVNVVETAAATYKMRHSNMDAAAVLDAQIIAHNQTVEQTK